MIHTTDHVILIRGLCPVSKLTPHPCRGISLPLSLSQQCKSNRSGTDEQSLLPHVLGSRSRIAVSTAELRTLRDSASYACARGALIFYRPTPTDRPAPNTGLNHSPLPHLSLNRLHRPGGRVVTRKLVPEAVFSGTNKFG